MKIRRITIKNITSYREETVFSFDSRINILIGTNGGGKTNLQKILALTLSKYFIHQYQFLRDDNGVRVEQHDPWKLRTLKLAFPPYIGQNMGEQLIEIELGPDSSDVDNIKAIGLNLDKFNEQLSFWEKTYSSYEPLPFADEIANSTSFVYRIRNLELEPSEPNSAAWAFREYLREFFIFLRVAARVPNVTLTSPVFFFSSDRTLSRRFEIQAGQLTEQTYFDGHRSAYQAATGESMNLMQWATQHFVRLHRAAVIEGANTTGKTWRDFFEQYADVKLLSKYLAQLGYKWDFSTDVDQLSYQFVLTKGDESRSTEMFSSGEREIVHFLLAMFALNVRDGLILVDEPELHLHPRWQKIFLGLFRDLAEERNNQFIVTTHSPVFVTPETIDSVTRVFRSPRSGSARIALRDVELPEKKNLVRMINSQNNERLFFADKVVLVEGISDRLVIEALIEHVCLEFNISEAIEVVEVGGKQNMTDYERVLRGMLTPVVTVADRDHLTNVGLEQSRGLFVSDHEKQWKVLTKDKKSIDRVSLVALLEGAIGTGDRSELEKFLAYFKTRFKALKDSLTDKEAGILLAEFNRLEEQGIFLLRAGEIEDYLPLDKRDVRGIVELISSPDWVNTLPCPERRVELGKIVCAVVGIEEKSREEFLTALRNATVTSRRSSSQKRTGEGLGDVAH